MENLPIGLRIKKLESELVRDRGLFRKMFMNIIKKGRLREKNFDELYETKENLMKLSEEATKKHGEYVQLISADKDNFTHPVYKDFLDYSVKILNEVYNEIKLRDEMLGGFDGRVY